MNLLGHRFFKGYLAWLFYAYASVAHAAPHAQAPVEQGIQLGDSVGLPTRTIVGSHESAVAFFLQDKELLPESVAYDLKDGSFYIGSTRKGKIVRRDKNGIESDFIKPRQDGLWEVIGIKIHPTRRMLWVCSLEDKDLEGYQKRDRSAAGIFVFNLDTSKLIRKWVMDIPGEAHGFNDLVVTRGNDVYATHMFKDAAIYRITDKEQKLEVFVAPPELKEPNGITITPDEKTLYVAGLDGVMSIDIASKKSQVVKAPEGENTGGIDGLYYYKGDLLAIQNNSINRYQFDETHTRIVVNNVLEMNHPLMKIPTTGVIVGDQFYYVANANFRAVKADGTLDPALLTEPAILKLKLY